MSYQTTQEEFWAGSFGNEYIHRNNAKSLSGSNYSLFSDMLKRSRGIRTVLEIGANIGRNLTAINNLLPESSTSAIEINKYACDILETICTGKVFSSSIQNISLGECGLYDFVFTKGVLIHIAPSSLNDVYEKIYQLSNKYIGIIEYYNPVPVTLNYRGEIDKLFKRDFAGEMLDKYSDLMLVDYGFKYHRDNNFSQDDLTWFLLEKVRK